MNARITVFLLAASLAAGSAPYAAARTDGPVSCCTAPHIQVASVQTTPAKSAAKRTAKPAPKKPAKPAPKAQRKVVATYFHGDFRCESCRRIEEWTAETIRASFRDDLRAGRIAWRVVNIDRPANEHYKKDYQLTAQSVILSDVKGSKETRWKNLGLVWSYLGDEPTFRNYVREEVAAYLKGL